MGFWNEQWTAAAKTKGKRWSKKKIVKTIGDGSNPNFQMERQIA
jgi:hypothetical protein